jgi:hypothetical protein
MAFVSVALDPRPDSWDRAFVLADRLERADPARVGLAPLRIRLNLLAATAGVKPEVDLWPHLRGVTGCILGGSEQPGRSTGAVLVLHLDNEFAAAHLVQDFELRLGAIRPEGESKRESDQDARPQYPGADVAGRGLRQLGMVGGRVLTIWRRVRDVAISWGDTALADSLKTKGNRRPSLADVCSGWTREGKGPPQRVGAFWPGRSWRPLGSLEPPAAALRVLADDPPVVWWGWSDSAKAQDSLRWSDLPARVRHFLETIAFDPPRIP